MMRQKVCLTAEGSDLRGLNGVTGAPRAAEGNALGRLRCGEADELGTGKRKGRGDEDAADALEAVGERARTG
jgi:hypothetical protein